MKIQVMTKCFLLLCACTLFLTGCGRSAVGGYAHGPYYEDARFDRNRSGYDHGGGRYYRTGSHYRSGGSYHRSYRSLYH